MPRVTVNLKKSVLRSPRTQEVNSASEAKGKKKKKKKNMDWKVKFSSENEGAGGREEDRNRPGMTELIEC